MLTIQKNSVDELVFAAIQHISCTGTRISARAGAALQSYEVCYILENSCNRLFSARHPASTRYLCMELQAFFRGSLRASDGLSQASGFWDSISDQDGYIWSNYGHYVFYQGAEKQSQYEWVIEMLRENPLSRRAIINVNQPIHKQATSKDFPCAVSLQFYVRDDALHCTVFSRSEDVIWGLPYDIGFFSFMTELVCVDLNERFCLSLSVGQTAVCCVFTQIYDRTAHIANEVVARGVSSGRTIQMPLISSARAVLDDIRAGSSSSDVVKWIARHASEPEQ